ncbi:MAG: DUF192 domain-containing protein [Candidatus Omnitrophota bacterium]
MSVNFSRLVLIVTFVIVWFGYSSAADMIYKARVCVKDACVNAEIADTDGARMTGLMYRGSLAENGGMLFVFPGPGRYSFWMMNMRFPLDIIWIDETRRIVDIKAGVEPCAAGSCESILPRSDALYVLEVPAGFTLRHQAAIGDTVSITHIKSDRF